MSSKGKSSAATGSGAALVPKLRFPEFQDAEQWQINAFAKLFTIGNGRDHKHLSPGSVPVYGSGGFMRLVDEHLYEGESVCIGRKGTIDNPMFLTGKFWTVDTLFYTHSFKHCLPKFIFAIFQQIDWRKHNEAGGVPSLSKANIEKIEAATPSLPEQQKIAECLDSADALIAAQGRKVEALRAHKKGLMQQLFPEEGETQPRLRFPEFEGAVEWEEAKLQAACNMQAGKFVAASEIHERAAEKLFPCYGGNGLRGYTTSFTHSGKYPLIGRQGALCGNVKFAVGKFHATEHAVVASPKKGVSVDWLFYLLDHLDLNQFATGQAQPGLSVDVLNNALTSIPKDEAEQQRIADCLTSLDDLIAAEIRKLNTLKTHKKGLMQQLFPQVGEDDA